MTSENILPIALYMNRPSYGGCIETDLAAKLFFLYDPDFYDKLQSYLERDDVQKRIIVDDGIVKCRKSSWPEFDDASPETDSKLMNIKEHILVNSSGEYPQMPSAQSLVWSGQDSSPQYLDHVMTQLRNNGWLAGGLSGKMPNTDSNRDTW
jgi:hypothetical protein